MQQKSDSINKSPLSRRVQFNTEEEWLAWRQDRICASDVPIILGQSPHKTSYELFLEKTGQKKIELTSDQKELFSKAKEAEILVLNKYLRDTGKWQGEEYEIIPQFCLEYDWIIPLGCSIDFLILYKGWAKAIVEVKTVAKEAVYSCIPIQFKSQIAAQNQLISRYIPPEKKDASDFWKNLGYIDCILLRANQKDIEANPDSFEIRADDLYFDSIRIEISGTAPLRNFYAAMKNKDYTLFAPIPKDPTSNTFLTLPKEVSVEKDYLEAEEKFRQAKEALEKAKERLMSSLDIDANYAGKLLDIKVSWTKGRVEYPKIKNLEFENLDAVRGEPIRKTTIFNKSRNMVD